MTVAWTELRGARVTMTIFGMADVSARYVGWLNDPVVNEYSRRRDLPPTDAESAKAWLRTLAQDEAVYAVHAPTFGHIGNVKVGPLDHANARADLSIMLGERAAWGHGFGAEALYTLTRHLFEKVGLNRVDAGSANPSFLAMVKKLGWSVEGVLRERVRLAGQFVDWTLVAQLKRNFQRMPHLEAAHRT